MLVLRRLGPPLSTLLDKGTYPCEETGHTQGWVLGAEGGKPSPLRQEVG